MSLSAEDNLESHGAVGHTYLRTALQKPVCYCTECNLTQDILSSTDKSYSAIACNSINRV